MARAIDVDRFDDGCGQGGEGEGAMLVEKLIEDTGAKGGSASKLRRRLLEYHCQSPRSRAEAGGRAQAKKSGGGRSDRGGSGKGKGNNAAGSRARGGKGGSNGGSGGKKDTEGKKKAGNKAKVSTVDVSALLSEGLGRGKSKKKPAKRK